MRKILNCQGLKIYLKDRLVNTSTAVAEWGKGYKWIKFFEVFECVFSAEASFRIKSAVPVNHGNLILLSRREVMDNPRHDLADNTFAIIDGFTDLSDPEKNNLVRKVNQNSYYGDWRIYTKSEDIIGVSVAGLAKIKINGDYLFMKQHNLYVPLGGVYTYAAKVDREYLESLGAFGFLEDTGHPDFHKDLRFLLPTKKVFEFEQWLSIQLDRRVNPRIERHPVRELREELEYELGVFNHEEFDDLLRPPVQSDIKPYFVQEKIQDLWRQEDTSGKIDAIRTLSKQDNPAVRIKIRHALGDSDPEVRKEALRSLADLMADYLPARRGISLPYLESLAEITDPGCDFETLLSSTSREKVIAKWLKSIGIRAIEREFASLLSENIGTYESLIHNYQEDPSLAKNEPINLLISVKRIEDPKEEVFHHKPYSRPDLVGRESWRPYYNGLILSIPLSCQTIGEGYATWKRSLTEPYDFVVSKDNILVSVGNGIIYLDKELNEVRELSSEWFAQIHSLDISKNKESLLVTSSGFDAILEISINTGKKTWDWFAFEHGFASTSPFKIARSNKQAKILEASGYNVCLTDDFKDDSGFGIPTRYRVHINESRYASDNRILVTIAQDGSAIIINRKSKSGKEWIAGLLTPHSFTEISKGCYYITDTRSGRLLISDSRGEIDRQITLSGLPGLTNRSRDGVEWLQSAVMIKPGLFLLVDSARDHLVLVDVDSKIYRLIETPNCWRIHRVLPVNRLRQEEQLELG